MNARQKAKYYKRKYLELANAPVPKVFVTPKDVVRVEAVRNVDAVDVLRNMREAEEITMKILGEELLAKVMNCIDFKSYYDIMMNRYRVRARLEVLYSRPVYRFKLFTNESAQAEIVTGEMSSDFAEVREVNNNDK